ncbi:MAG: photosystem I assembly protein Ycf3 [Alphaproteobacteria bacterium ADurb.Bin438]|nr:MAG: photosystem I assembly protein Ycf3 [Alphaproteobacteria bacterium ADurb.Bin438]
MITEKIKQGDYEKALEIISGLDDLDYNLYIKPFVMAWIYQKLGDYEKAYLTLDILKQEKVFGAIYNFNMAMLKESEGKMDEAKTHYMSALTNTSGLSLTAVKIIGRFLKNNGDEGLSEEIRKKYRDINPLINDEVKVTYDNLPEIGYKYAIAEVYFGFASIVPLQDMYHSDFATTFYNLSLYMYPEFSLAKMFLADNLTYENEINDANALYLSLGKEDEFYIASRLKLGHNLAKLEKLEEAKKIFEELAWEYKNIVEPYMELGDIYRFRGDFKNALKSYDLALKRMDKKHGAYFVILYNKGICLERLKRWGEAEKVLLEALSLNPDNPYILNYLGYCWIDRGINFEKSYEMIKKAFSLAKEDGHIADSLAWAYYLAGDYEKALIYMEYALSLEPSNSIIIDHLGDIYWELQRKNEARYQWSKALELNVDLEEKDRINIGKKLKYGKSKNIPKFKIKEEPKKEVKKEIKPKKSKKVDKK